MDIIKWLRKRKEAKWDKKCKELIERNFGKHATADGYLWVGERARILFDNKNKPSN